MITLEVHNGITVLRDDKLLGGTKSVIVEKIIQPGKQYVYASPVYGGFQIALAEQLGPAAHIFCAKRKVLHPNTVAVMKAGANVYQVAHGYLSVVEKAARMFCYDSSDSVVKIAFGAAEHKAILVERVKQVIKAYGSEPNEIWCAIGSGTLFEAILEGTKKAHVIGVTVGKHYENFHKRADIYHHPLQFEKESKYKCPFPSMPNYDLKAWEWCNKIKDYDFYDKDVLFWNVL